jgi:hypothetical protein
MDHLGDALADLRDAVTRVATAALADDGLRACDDDGVLSALAAAGSIRRAAEAMMIEAVAQLRDRDDAAPHPDRVTTRYGCRDHAELVQRATRVSRRTAGEILSAADAVQQTTALSSGEVLPAEFPAMRAALAEGAVGLDGVVAVAGAFRGCAAGRDALLAADAELAAAARGDGADAAPPASADQLRAYAAVWAAYLDQDGTEPDDTTALRKRAFTIGRRRDDGLVPVRGDLLPEVAAQLQREFDSILNPRLQPAPGTGPRFVESAEDGSGAIDGSGHPDEPLEATADPRTRSQRQHDALATILSSAASSGALPTLGGAAPTLVVSVREEDLGSGRGYAHLPGDDQPIPLAVARHIACTGAIERVVLADNGRIVSLSTLERVFNHHQRKAIALRDGGCIIPGCHVRPEWCEIHHVREHAHGGPTHTDNGVLLCWFHHRTIDTGGWSIRMTHGTPEVRGPAWWDPTRRWRPTTTSPARRQHRLKLRT